MIRGRGYLPNTAAHRASRRMFAPRAGALPEEALGLVAPAAIHAPAWDQGQTGSCTGHGAADGFSIAFAAVGQPLPFRPSPRCLYTNGRAIDRVFVDGVPSTKLADDGAMPSSVIRAANLYGIRGTKAANGIDSDADPATINAEPELGDIEAEALTRPLGEFGITSVSEGASRADVVQNVRSALAALHPVGIAANADGPFQSWTGGRAYTPPPNAPPPDHWISLIGYRLGEAGFEFVLKNSWGADWGAVVEHEGVALFGCMWVTEGFLATCTDLTVYVPEKF